MGGLEENIRTLNNYTTIFGSQWFNIACNVCNIIEILTTVILLGYYHSVITIDYIWWPCIELTRLFILTILRFDVMIKSVENYNDNRSGYRYTKRLIIICNLIGFFVILIGSPIYLALLSIPESSNSDLKTIYTILMCIFPIFILIRIILTLPMYCILFTGTNPIYSLHQEYQRIDTALQSNARRRARRRRRDGDYNELDEPMNSEEERNDRYQRQIRRQFRIMQLEQRQMELAMEESRREAFRNTRKQQDEEYKRALQEEEAGGKPMQNLIEEEPQNKPDTHSHLIDINPMTMTSQNNTITSTISSDKEIKSSDNSINNISEEDLLNAQTPNSIPETQMISNIIQLDPLSEEAPDNSQSVSVRIRLRNGMHYERRFDHLATIKDVILWCSHELQKGNQRHLINNFRLASTMPRTVYDDKTKTMKDLRFWRPNTNRKLVSPLLYVEEK